MSKIIVGLAGPIGSGKDTVGEIIAKYFDAKMIAWADELYRQVGEAFNVPVSFLQNRNTKESPQNELALIHCQDEDFLKLMVGELGYDIHEPRSPRFILQHWGTEYRRAQDHDYFVKKTAETIDATSESAIFVSGTRFLNEVAMTRSKGGFLLHVTRPGVARVKNHESEIDLAVELADYEISNDSDLAGLEMKACSIAIRMGLSRREGIELPQSIKQTRRLA